MIPLEKPTSLERDTLRALKKMARDESERASVKRTGKDYYTISGLQITGIGFFERLEKYLDITFWCILGLRTRAFKLEFECTVKDFARHRF
ncbi:MAG: hypothetical protein OXC46_00185 [Thaumarchaeota archaeon]|nr:hypothetical protein [Nitrososphaerota archaeon]